MSLSHPSVVSFVERKQYHDSSEFGLSFEPFIGW